MGNNFEQMKRDCLGPAYKNDSSLRMSGPTKVCMPYKKGGFVKRVKHFIGGNVSSNNIDPSNIPQANMTQQPNTIQQPQFPYSTPAAQNVNQPTMPLRKGGMVRDCRAIGGVGKVRKGEY